MEDKYTHPSFLDLFDEITYAYERSYGVRKRSFQDLHCISFHKLTLWSDGTGFYKTSKYTFPKHLWWKVVKLANLLEETPTEKVLYNKI